MPNWCNNTMYISHPDKKMMKKALTAWNSGKFLSTLVPEPDYTKVKVKPTFDTSHITGKPKPDFVEPEQAWWDWRVQNWGTKWDIGWSPPTDAYTTLVEMGYSIKSYYYEGGCAFCGIWEDGDEDFYNIDPPEGVKTSEWVRENIPKELDEEMGISESYESFEEDEEEEENA